MNDILLIIFAILSVINLVIFVNVAKFYRNNKQLIGLAKQMATTLGRKSGVVRQGKALQKQTQEAKLRIASNIKKQIPIFGDIIEDEDVFLLMNDPQAIQGLINVAKIVGYVGGAVKDAIPKIGNLGRNRRERSNVGTMG